MELYLLISLHLSFYLIYGIINIITNDFPIINQLNKFNKYINLGDLIAISGSIDSVSGSVDLVFILVLSDPFILDLFLV